MRDSELTNHGFQQATRLGQHFKTLELTFSNLYSSQLQRAAKTAGKIREAQLSTGGDDDPARTVPDVVQLELLQEQDFGSMEGKKFYERPPDANITGKEQHRRESKDVPGFVDVESKVSMGRRADTFLDEHLLPLLNGPAEGTEKCIAIVSHGIFLSTMWKRLLLRLPPKSVALSPELQATARPSLEHLGGWSNTGYLEIFLTRAVSNKEEVPLSPSPTALPSTEANENNALGMVEVPRIAAEPVGAEKQAAAEQAKEPSSEQRPEYTRIAHGWETTILAINGKDHLKGLKRTGGGVGSSRHDASQKSIETFFKRRKVE